MNDLHEFPFCSSRNVRAAIFITAILLMIGCGGPGSGAGSNNKPPADRPPTQVDVVRVLSASIREYRVFTGRTAAAHSVEIRPRVGGYLIQAPNNSNVQISQSFGGSNKSGWQFLTASADDDTPTRNSDNLFVVSAKEGDIVEAGTPLFQIDPRPFELTLQQARGTLEALVAQRERLNNDLDRLRRLQQTNSISESDFELAEANLEESAGQKDALEAAVRRAELDLEFTQIRAPIAGVIGRTLVNPANVVSADTTILTTIVSIDPVHVFFDLDEASFLTFRDFAKTDPNLSDSILSVPVSLELSNESGFPHKGIIDFQNNTTDSGSGNTLIRAEFANSKGSLSPGLFCRVRVPFSEPRPTLLVPTKCLAMDQQGKYVVVVDQSNVALRRSVTTKGTQGSFTIIERGLQEGESVIYEGLQKIRPKDRVDPIQSSNAPAFVDPLRGSEK